MSSEHETNEITIKNSQTPGLKLGADEAPAVRFVNEMLAIAIEHRASDVHLEPFENFFRIRFRIDGVLHERARPPQALGKQLVARLKIMTKLDIAERRLPQDGRLQIQGQEKKFDFRVNTLPTLWGEKLVLRLLNLDNLYIQIDQLGMNDQQKSLYLEALRRPQGMILVTGPTGSGKTVSLYAGLNLLNKPDINISTVEDPIEIGLAGINQVQVNVKVGLDFATTLRAFLRQDPDILMVGEIRDTQTAEIAVKAAQTGHRVLSTLHTNQAVETFSRLRNLGISNLNLATSVSLVIAQKLARRLCGHCKKLQKLPPKTLLEEGFTEQSLAELKLFEAGQCPKCMDGYKGRTGLYEILPISPELTELIMVDADVNALGRQAASEGFQTLRQCALEKVAQGITSLHEVNRVVY